MNAAQKSKLYDLAAASPVIILFMFEIGLSLLLIYQSLNVRLGPLAIFSQLSSVVFSSLLILLFVIRRPPVQKAAGWTPRLAGALGFLLPLIVLVLPRAKLTLSMMIFSSVVVLLGTLASIVIVFWLGRSFSIFPQARGLVTGGPYRVMRHPLYLAEIVVFWSDVDI